MSQLRVGVVGQSLDAVLLTQSFEQLFGVEVAPIEFPEDPLDVTRMLRVSPSRRDRRLCALVEADLSDSEGLGRWLACARGGPLATELDSVASLLEERMQRPGPPLIPITPWRFAPDLQVGARHSIGRCAGRSGVVPGHDARPGSILKSDIALAWKRSVSAAASSCIRVG
jgi:hypothetical protein